MELGHPDQLVEDCRGALQSVRRALIEVYDAIGADPQAPVAVAKTCKINRNLTWKLSRVMGAPEPLAALNHLPGERSIQLAMTAFGKAGAPVSAVAGLRSALAALEEVAREHAGTREHLELMLESMGLLEREASMESARELAFRGTSGVWGIQARARTSTAWIAPGTVPGTVTFACLSGTLGLRRLRPSVRWCLYYGQQMDDRGRVLSASEGIGVMGEILPHAPGDPAMLLREFCSPNLPQLVSVRGANGISVHLPAGQAGNRGAFDSYFGHVVRGYSAVRTERDRYGGVAVNVALPTETLIVDALIHKDVAMPTSPELKLFGFPMNTPGTGELADTNEMPVHEKIVELDGSPPPVAHPAAPGLTRAVDGVYRAMGWNPADFRGLRAVFKHPPMGTKAMMRWELPEA